MLSEKLAICLVGGVSENFGWLFVISYLLFDFVSFHLSFVICCFFTIKLCCREGSCGDLWPTFQVELRAHSFNHRQVLISQNIDGNFIEIVDRKMTLSH